MSERQDIAVMQNEEGDWITVTPDNRFRWHRNEDEACAYQRQWRNFYGLDPMTGEATT